MKLGLLALLFVLQFQGALIQNGDFQNGTNPNSTKPAGSTDIQGWLVLSAGVDWVDGVATVPEILGTNGALYIDLNGNQPVPGGIQQSVTTTVGTRYSVTFDMNANTITGASKILEVSAGAESQAFTFTPSGSTDIVWEQKAFQFVATNTTTTLTFMSLVNGTNAGPLLDNVQIAEISDIPEPETMGLVATGILFAVIALSKGR